MLIILYTIYMPDWLMDKADIFICPLGKYKKKK